MPRSSFASAATCFSAAVRRRERSGSASTRGVARSTAFRLSITSTGSAPSSADAHRALSSTAPRVLAATRGATWRTRTGPFSVRFGSRASQSVPRYPRATSEMKA